MRTFIKDICLALHHLQWISLQSTSRRQISFDTEDNKLFDDEKDANKLCNDDDCDGYNDGDENDNNDNRRMTMKTIITKYYFTVTLEEHQSSQKQGPCWVWAPCTMLGPWWCILEPPRSAGQPSCRSPLQWWNQGRSWSGRRDWRRCMDGGWKNWTG